MVSPLAVVRGNQYPLGNVKEHIGKEEFLPLSLPTVSTQWGLVTGRCPFLTIPWVFEDLHFEAHSPPPPFLLLTLEIGSKRYFSVVVVNTEKLGSEGCFRTVATSI